MNKKDLEHVALLARLALSDEELKKYGKQISAILSYIDQLSEVDTTNIEPTAQVTGMENIYRADEIIPWDKSEQSAALKQAPELEDGQIKVKRVLK